METEPTQTMSPKDSVMNLKDSPKANTPMQLADSGTRRKFDGGAVRDMAEGKGQFYQLPMFALEKLAHLIEAGNKKYGNAPDGQGNWTLGIPTHVFADSALRHLCKHIRGDRDEAHLIQAAWNIMVWIDTEERANRGILPPSVLTLPNPQAKSNEDLTERLKTASDDAREVLSGASTEVKASLEDEAREIAGDSYLEEIDEGIRRFVHVNGFKDGTKEIRLRGDKVSIVCEDGEITALFLLRSEVLGNVKEGFWKEITGEGDSK